MSEWISVDAQLPDHDADVLLVTREREVIAGYLCSEDICPWRIYDGRKVRSEITHWMPLPEPPK